MLRSISAVVLLLFVGVGPVMASEGDVSATPAAIGPIQKPQGLVPLSLHRPATLPALYGGFVALQVLDGYTTTQARGRGAHEVNPMLGNGHAASLWAVKAATTAGTIYFVERTWKKNRVGAVLLMVGINSGYAVIAAHNTRVARSR